MGLDQKIDVRIEALGDTDGLKGMWLDLQARARHSFFQSWMSSFRILMTIFHSVPRT
jgi:hypothetical protein